MSDSVETLTTDVKNLKSELVALRAGGANEAASKRKKHPQTEVEVVREARKRLRRASSKLSVEKKRSELAAARAKKKEGKS